MCHQVNKLEPCHIVYILQQYENPLILTQLTDSKYIGEQRQLQKRSAH